MSLSSLPPAGKQKHYAIRQEVLLAAQLNKNPVRRDAGELDSTINNRRII